MIERAKAYSSYETSRINSAMIVYCIAAIGAMWIFKSIGIQTLSMFILALIVAEAMSFFTMYFSTRGKNETIN
jgi:type IV secretory pathway VirB2 component (pilin)